MISVLVVYMMWQFPASNFYRKKFYMINKEFKNMINKIKKALHHQNDLTVIIGFFSSKLYSTKIRISGVSVPYSKTHPLCTLQKYEFYA